MSISLYMYSSDVVHVPWIMSLIGALVLFTFILLPPPLPVRSSDNTDDLMPLELEPHVFGFPFVVTNLIKKNKKDFRW